MGSSRTRRHAHVLLVIPAAVFLLAPPGARAQTLTLLPQSFTTGVSQTQDFIAQVTGTTDKRVRVSVCDANATNCVAGGNSTIGTVAVVGQDAKKNRIIRYTAPASVPAPPACATVTDGCLLKIKVRLLVVKLVRKAAVTISPTATNPIPLLTSISPTSAAAGDPGFTLTANGSGFVGSTVVRWNGNARTTTFGSDTQVTADILTTDLDVPGPLFVTAFNPAPAGGESNALKFTVSAGSARLVERSSRASDGTEGSAASSAPSMSGDRFMAFASDANNLVASDTNGVTDVFVRDTCLGADPCPANRTRRASLSNGGVEGNSASTNPFISGSGRFVAFLSLSNNLVANDTNGAADIFVRDTCQGVANGTDGCPSTRRVSLANDGSEGDNGAVGTPVVSNNGRLVVFASDAGNLVAGDTNGVTDVFFRDTCFSVVGCTPTTIRVSVSSGGAEGSGPSASPAMTPDGRFIAFTSDADNLIGNDTNGVRDIFVRDTCRGVAGCTPSTRRVSVSSDGTQGSGPSFAPAISSDGRFIAFASEADNLVGNDTNGVRDIFVRDTCRGASGCTPATRRVSAGSGGQGDAFSTQPWISETGRFVVFASDSDNLVAGDTNGVRDVFLRDTCVGAKNCTAATLRLSVSRTGAQASGPSFDPVITRDGHFVVYTSAANDLVVSDTNGVTDVFTGRTGR